MKWFWIGFLLAVACEALVRLGLFAGLLPKPSAVLVWSFENLGRLWFHTIQTLLETIAGFSLAFAIACIFGMSIDLLPRFRKSIVSILAASNGIPKIVFAPLLFIWLGYDMTPKIVMSALIAFFPIVIGFAHGLDLVDESLDSFIRTTGAKWHQAFLLVRLPWAAKTILAGCKIAIGLALVGAIVAEFINAGRGLGYLIKLGLDEFELEMQFAGILSASLIGLLLYGSLEVLGRSFFKIYPPLEKSERRSY